MLTALAGLLLIPAVFMHFVLERYTPQTYRIIEESVLGSQFLWVIVVLFRKTFQLSTGHHRVVFGTFFNPQGKEAKAARALTITILLPIGAIIVLLIGTLLKLPTRILMWFIILLFYSAFFGTYLNHIVEAMPFQMKLIGIILITMLCIVGLFVVVVGRSYENNYKNMSFLHDNQTISFVPNEYGGYNILRVPIRFDSDLGQALEFGNSDTKVLDLKFPFTFFDRLYEEIHIANEKAIILLGDIGITQPVWGGFNALPAIAPMYMMLDPDNGLGIFQKSEAEKTTITWYMLPALHSSEPNTIQLVLHRNGLFDISYKELNPGMVYRVMDRKLSVNIVGVHPGGRNTPLEPIRFSDDLPYLSSSHSVIFEDYYTDFEKDLSARMLPHALILIISSLFIIFVFPVVFKSSLIKPLQNLLKGMQKVDRGDLEVSVTPLFNDEIGMVTAVFNRMVQSVKRAEEKLIQQEKRAVVGDLAVGIIHEMKNQLTTIGYLDLILDKLPAEAEEEKQFAKFIFDSRDRMIGIIDEIRGLARNEESDYELRVDNLEHVITEAIQLAKMDSEVKSKDIFFESHYNGDSVINKNKIIQVLLNLIRNAAQAIENIENGKIRVLTETKEPFVLVEIIDNGIGIEKEKLERIWKPFFSTKGEKGTGVGLDICKRIIEGHKGIISCESELNKGTTFTFSLLISEK